MEMSYPKTIEEAEFAIRLLDEQISLLADAKKMLLRAEVYPQIREDFPESEGARGGGHGESLGA